MRERTALTRFILKGMCLLLLASLFSTLLVQGQQPTQKNYVLLAHEFLRALYPGLTGHGYIMSLESSFRYDIPTENNLFNLYVGRGPKNMVIGYLGGYEGSGPPPPGLHPGPAHPEQLLASSFEFDAGGAIVSFAATGSALGDPKRQDDANERIRALEEATDAEAAAILKEVGATFTPDKKDELMRHLPIEKLQRFLGPLKESSVRSPTLRDETNGRFTWPEWHVTATNGLVGDHARVYDMWFEPFKGDLVRISVNSPASAKKPDQN